MVVHEHDAVARKDGERSHRDPRQPEAAEELRLARREPFVVADHNHEAAPLWPSLCLRRRSCVLSLEPVANAAVAVLLQHDRTRAARAEVRKHRFGARVRVDDDAVAWGRWRRERLLQDYRDGSLVRVQPRRQLRRAYLDDQSVRR